MKRKKLLYQLFSSYLTIIVISVVILVWFTNRSLQDFYYQQKSIDLKARAILVQYDITAEALENPARLAAICRNLGETTQTRITIISPDGRVLADSHEDPSLMDNHGDRPEIISAFNGETGTALRYSHTLEQKMMYLAIPVKIGGQKVIVRTSLPVTTLQATISEMRIKLILGGLVIVLFAALISFLLSKRIARPLETMKQGAERFAKGELNFKLPVPNTEEIGTLAESLNLMARQLDERIKTIVNQRNEQEAVFSSMVEGVIAVDQEERILSMNLAAAKLFRIDRENVVGKPIHEVLRNSELIQTIRAVLKNGTVSESEITLSIERERYLQITGTVLKSGGGERIGAVIVLEDITRIRQLENIRKEFVANVSHELKTPITSIKGFVETLREGAVKNPQEAAQFLDIIEKHTNRLNAIINDLLELSRIEQKEDSGDIAMTMMPVADILQRAAEDCQSQATRKGVLLRVSCSQDLKAPMNAPLIEQAIVNLIDNAIKFSDSGREVLISARRDGNQVVISVQDFGPGIAPEHFDRLFERFYRVDRARSRKLGGTGLGLAIVKHIAQVHGGDVSVSSKIGEGSIFSIRIRTDA